MKTVLLCLSLLMLLSMSVFADHVAQDDITPDVPRDGIPPLDNPKYDPVAEATWWADDDWMLVYERNGDARAYPINIMNWHEIVNDTIGELDVLVTYCPLCRSGIVFDRRWSQADISPEAQGVLPEGTILEFGNTGSLYESDMVMYDRQTDSQWFQVGGDALIGPLHGVTMKRLPSSMMPWIVFKDIHPHGLVLSKDTGYKNRDYDHDMFERYSQNQERLYFGTSVKDERLPLKSRILGVGFDGVHRAYYLDSLDDGVYMDQVGQQPLVLFVQQSAGVAYDPRLDGRTLSFHFQDDAFVDEQTRSIWDFSGKATSGELEGSQLARLTQTNIYWFSWAIHQPDTDIVPEVEDFQPYAADETTAPEPAVRASDVEMETESEPQQTLNASSREDQTTDDESNAAMPSWIWGVLIGVVVALAGLLIFGLNKN